MKPKGVRRCRDQVGLVSEGSSRLVSCSVFLRCVAVGVGCFGSEGLSGLFGPGWLRRSRSSGGCGVPGRSWLLRLGQPLAILLLSRPSRLFLEGQAASSRVTVSNNRSVMPLDVLGRTRATLKESACFTLPVRKDRVTAEPPSWLGLGTAMIPMNQESLVGAGH